MAFTRLLSGVTVAAAVWLTAAVLLPGADAPPQDQAPQAAPPNLRLFEQEPFDELRFTDGTTAKIVPLDVEPRKPPERPKFSGRKLEVRLLERPAEKYEAQWKDIAEVRLWEQLILDEADRLVADAKYDEAYDYFDFLLTHHKDWPGLAESVERFLFEDAAAWRKKGRHDYELALLTELYRRNPSRQGLSDALAAVTVKLMAPEHERQEYAAVRRLLKDLDGMYPEHATVAEWKQRLTGEAAALVAQAREDRQAGRLREAYAAATRAVRIWPALEEARQLLIDVQTEYPRVIVGVQQPAGAALTDRLDDWASHRSRRLVERTLEEFTGHGPQGGQYSSPYGELTKLDLDLTLSFRLSPNTAWPGGKGVVTGYDVARLALALADPGRACYRAEWAALFRRVTVHDVFDVDIELSRPHVRPEALLQQGLVAGPFPAAGSPAREPSIGPYAVQPPSAAETVFLGNADYFARRPRQPREIVERRFDDGRDAVVALRRGEVDALDRVNPWELKRLRADKEVVIEEYAVPTVHCLIPNLANPLLATRLFRRALVYGIPRETILTQQILQGESLAPSQVISGPFPIGRDSNDPLGYAYNDQVSPRAYEPRLAITLAQLALNVVNQKQGQAEPLKQLPELVLAYPPDDVARVACRAIAQHLKQVEIPISLVELPADPTAPPPSYDLLYAELSMWEPVTDVRRLLGTGGLVGQASAYVDLALRQLDEADGWKAARDKLLEIHRLVHEDVTVIPLWQLSDYFAYRKGLKGIGPHPVTLYQRIEQWELTPWLPDEAL